MKIEIVVVEKLLEGFDEWWEESGFQSRAEAIRALMRKVVNSQKE